jgi:hypothetical protein
VRATVVVAEVDAFGIASGWRSSARRWWCRWPPWSSRRVHPDHRSFLAGSVAVLVALVSQGPFTALIALGSSSPSCSSRGTCCSRCSSAGRCTVHPQAVVLAIAAGLLSPASSGR